MGKHTDNKSNTARMIRMIDNESTLSFALVSLGEAPLSHNFDLAWHIRSAKGNVAIEAIRAGKHADYARVTSHYAAI